LVTGSSTQGTAITEAHTVSLHDALPIYESIVVLVFVALRDEVIIEIEVIVVSLHNALLTTSYAHHGPESSTLGRLTNLGPSPPRSEEHTSELQSRENLVCRLLLEKKKER